MSRARRRSHTAPVAGESAVHALDGPAVVLDAQGFSLLAEEDHHPRKRELLALLKVYERAGFIVGISAVTVAEERRTGTAGQRLDWWRSQLVRVPVSEPTALLARQLLEETGLDGHRSVVGALVVSTAASSPDVARVISSDASHIPKLCAAATAFRRIPVEFKQI